MEFLLGIYLGGGFVIFLFWVQDKESLSVQEIKITRQAMFLWPVYAAAIALYRVMKYFRGETYE